MKLGIMQPYFLPYLGYFSLIEAVDYWIVFDNVQYIRRGWVNRNRILKPSFDDWQYINVPLKKHSQNTVIKDIEISENVEWKEKIFRQLNHYKKKAPYFIQIINLLEQVLMQKNHTDINHLNVKLLEVICEYIGVEFRYNFFSKLDIDIGPIHSPGDWALNISKALSATTYINPPGGTEILDYQNFRNAGIELLFLKNNLASYSQGNEFFIPGLSIIDVLFFNSPEQVLRQVKNYNLENYE